MKENDEMFNQHQFVFMTQKWIILLGKYAEKLFKTPKWKQNTSSKGGYLFLNGKKIFFSNNKLKLHMYKDYISIAHGVGW